MFVAHLQNGQCWGEAARETCGCDAPCDMLHQLRGVTVPESVKDEKCRISSDSPVSYLTPLSLVGVAGAATHGLATLPHELDLG